MKDERVYLAHIFECIGKIQTYTADGRAVFLEQAMVQDAVIRNLEVIGEAARRVSEAFRDSHPDIPWRGLNALRNVLIHDYAGVDLVKVWNVVEKELPPLKDALTKILPPLEQLERELAGEE